PVMLVVFFGVLAGTVAMFVIVPKGFIPDQDNDTLNINLRAQQGTSYYEMVEDAKKVADLVRNNPNVDTFFVSTGGNFGSMNTARLNVQLKPRRQRKLSAAQIAQQLRPQLSRFPGFQAFINLPPAIQIGGRQSNSAYTLTVESADTANLYGWAKRLEDQILTLPEVQDVSDDMEMKSPRVNLVVDRDAAAAVGLTANDIESSLYDGLG